MSLPPDTLWYNGDWNLFVGIHETGGVCPCDPTDPDEGIKQEECVSRPPNQMNDPLLLMGTYTDFLVTDPFGWSVNGVFSNDFTTLPLSVLQTLSVTYEIRSNVSAYNGGTLIASGTTTAMVTPTGRSAMAGMVLYTEYQFLVTGLNIVLPTDRYWVNVAPILTPTQTALYGSEFLIFNSTTDGANAVGVPPGNNANDFFVVGNPSPTTYFIPSTDFGQEYHDFSNGVTGVVIPVCIDPDMEVTLQDEGQQIRIRDLKEGTLLRTADATRPARLIINYRNQTAHRVLVRILPDALRPGVPNKTLYVTTNHPIMVDGEKRKPRHLLNGSSIKRDRRQVPVNTHTLITDTGEPVMINGVPVCTWSIDEWESPHGHR